MLIIIIYWRRQGGTGPGDGSWESRFSILDTDILDSIFSTGTQAWVKSSTALKVNNSEYLKD